MNRNTAGRSHQSFVPRYAVSPRTALILLGANFLALFILRIDLFLSLSSELIGGYSGDGGLYFWLFRLMNNGARWSLFDSNALYPYSQTVAWSDNFILPAKLGGVMLSIGASPLIAYNLTLVIAMLLSGFFTSILTYHLSGDVICAKFAGIVFLGSAYLSSVIGHPQLQFVFWLPLGFDLLFAFFNSRKARYALFFGLLIYAAFLTTVYYAIFSALSGIILCVGMVLLRPRALSAKDWGRLTIFSTLGALPLLQSASPYLAVQETFGERHLYEPYFFSASFASFFSSGRDSLLYGWTAAWSSEEAHLFCGFLPVVLAVPLLARLAATKELKNAGTISVALISSVALFSLFGRVRTFEILTVLSSYAACAAAASFLLLLGVSERKLGAEYLTSRSLSALLLFIAVIFFMIALGPLGNSAENQYALGIYRIGFELFPGFDSLRAISRIGVVCLLMISLLSALSLAHLRRQSRVSRSLLALGYLLLFLENFSYPHTKESLPETPPVIEALARRAEAGTAMIVLPFSGALNQSREIASWREFARINVSAMNWALDANLKTVNGYSGQQTKIMKEFPRELYDFPSKRALAALSEIAGLSYVVFAPRFRDNFSDSDFERTLSAYGDEISLLEKDLQGNYLLKITPKRNLDRTFSLLVPSSPHRDIALRLRSKSIGNGEAKILPVRIGVLHEKFPYSTIAVKSDGAYHWYRLTLPKAESSVRPQRLYFAGADSEEVVFGGSALIDGSQSIPEIG